LRPKYLEIEGLQSFQKKQIIDFSSLDETGLFGIFGPTGSGKSTILDAITFALYGRVKRAERGTQGIINSNMDNVRVTFTFELLKDNSRKTYRVERDYRRKKGSENSSEPKVVRLLDITDGNEVPMCDKATEVSSSVEALLGLNHNDFTRAVVLPQNSFHEFLMLDNAGKRDMLERIFYLEIYGKELMDKTNRKITDFKSRIDILSGEMRGYADATEEALENAGREMKAALEDKKHIEEEFIAFDKKYNESKELWSNVKELNFLKIKQQEQEEKRKSIDEKKSILEKAGKAEGLIEKIKKIKKLSSSLSETENKLNEVICRLPVVKQDLDDAKQKYDEIKNKAALEMPGLVAYKTRLDDALKMRDFILELDKKISELGKEAKGLEIDLNTENEKMQTEKSLLEDIEKNITDLSQEASNIKIDPFYRQQLQDKVLLEKEITALNDKAEELKKSIYELNLKISDLNQKKNQAITQIENYQKAMDNLEKEHKSLEAFTPDSRKELLACKEKIHSVKSMAEALKIMKTDLDKTDSEIAWIENKLSAAVEKTEASSRVKEEKRIIFENQKSEEEKLSLELEENTAYMLSRKLKEGEPCPVCGSVLHPAPVLLNDECDLSDIEHRVKKARLLKIEAEEAYRNAERDYLIAAEQEKALETQKAQLLNERDLKHSAYNGEIQMLPPEYRDMELDALFAALEAKNYEYDNKLDKIDILEKKKDDFLTEYQGLKDNLAGERLRENGFTTEIEVIGETLSQLKDSLNSLNSEMADKNKQYQGFLNEYGIESASVELKKLSEMDQNSIQIQKQIETKQRHSAEKRTLIEKLIEKTRSLNESYIKMQAEINNLCNLKYENEKKIKDLTGDARIEDEIDRINKVISNYNSLETQYNQKYLSLEKQYNNLLSENAVYSSQADIYGNELSLEENLLKNLLAEKGFSDPEEVENSCVPKDRQEELKNEINEFEQAQLNLRAQIEITEKKIKSRTITEAEWNAIESRYREMSALREDCVSKCEITKSNYERIKAKYSKWDELNKEYTKILNKYNLYLQIQKLLKADKNKDNSFVDYIAEERLRYVAAKASELLGTMTGYKYALELDTDSGFVIRDNSNGGVHRMVTSLSGGETFLTSLSLALALSEQIQLKGQSPLEFFFLDEGFGTLDTRLLDTVIDSLEKLSSRERVIGIISHVPELKNRIARRLIVIPPASQSDGSKVVVEKA